MQNRISIDKIIPAVSSQKDDKLVIEEIKKIPIEEILTASIWNDETKDRKIQDFYKLSPTLENYKIFFKDLVQDDLLDLFMLKSSDLIYKKFDEIMKLMVSKNIPFDLEEMFLMYLEDPIIYGSCKENLDRNPPLKKKLLDFRDQHTLDVTKDVQLSMLFNQKIDSNLSYSITPKGYSQLTHYYNTKDNELYGYFSVGYHDFYASFHHLLTLLDKAKDGAQFIMLYRFDPESEGTHMTPIKCEKKNGKIHLIFVESHPSNPDYYCNALLSDSFSHRLSSITSEICLYRNTRILQTEQPVCFTLAIKYGRKLKQNDILSSLLKAKLPSETSCSHSWPIFRYEVPPYLMYLVSSPRQLDSYLKEVKGAEEAKLGFKQLSFKEHVLKSRRYPKISTPSKPPEIISPEIVQNIDYPTKSTDSHVFKSKAVFYFQAKHRDIIKNYFATMSQEELKTTIELMDPLQWHVNSKGEIVHRWVTTIMEGLENKEHKEIFALLDKHPSLMHRALNEKGQSLLHLAVEWSNQEVIKYLVSHNANVNFKDKEYLTALEWGNKLTKKYLNHKGGIFLQESILAYKEEKESLAQFKTLVHKQSQSKKKRKNTSTFFKNKSQKKELGGNPDKEKSFQNK